MRSSFKVCITVIVIFIFVKTDVVSIITSKVIVFSRGKELHESKLIFAKL